MGFAGPTLAFFLLGTVAAQSAPAPALTPPAAAALVADAMQRELPMELNGIVMRRVRAEGDLMIITVELPADSTDRNHTDYVRGFIVGACETQPNPLFENGIRVRVDTYPQGGATRESEVFTRCPTAPASS